MSGTLQHSRRCSNFSLNIFWINFAFWILSLRVFQFWTWICCYLNCDYWHKSDLSALSTHHCFPWNIISADALFLSLCEELSICYANLIGIFSYSTLRRFYATRKGWRGWTTNNDIYSNLCVAFKKKIELKWFRFWFIATVFFSVCRWLGLM